MHSKYQTQNESVEILQIFRIQTVSMLVCVYLNFKLPTTKCQQLLLKFFIQLLTRRGEQTLGFDPSCPCLSLRQEC